MTDTTNPTEDRTEPAPGYTVHEHPTLGWRYEGTRNGRANGGRTREDAVAETWEWHDFDRKRESEARVDWRTLSEQTGYRVLTLPDGSTITSADIRRVILRPASHERALDKHYPRCVVIGTAEASNAFTIYEDVDAVFAMATRAHREHGGRSSETGALRRLPAFGARPYSAETTAWRDGVAVDDGE